MQRLAAEQQLRSHCVELQIRIATEADLPAIVEIYNQSIPAGWSTADTRPGAQLKLRPGAY